MFKVWWNEELVISGTEQSASSSTYVTNALLYNLWNEAPLLYGESPVLPNTRVLLKWEGDLELFI